VVKVFFRNFAGIDKEKKVNRYMDYKRSKHNTPISTVIKYYLDKRSRRVSEARDEIQRRFFALDWRHQKRILPAFLSSGKADRDWASKQMLTNWDDSFVPIVKEVWERYHEDRLAWVVIRYLPTDYIKDNMDALSAGRNYFFICQRMIDDSEFCMDRSRLYESDYLSLLVKKKCEVSADVARDLFYVQMRRICLGDCKVRINDLTVFDDGTELVSIFGCYMVKPMLRAIERDLHLDDLYKELKEWMGKVSDAVMSSREWALLNGRDLPYGVTERVGLVLMRKYCYEHLDASFKVEGEGVDTQELEDWLEGLEGNAHIEEETRKSRGWWDSLSTKDAEAEGADDADGYLAMLQEELDAVRVFPDEEREDEGREKMEEIVYKEIDVPF